MISTTLGMLFLVETTSYESGFPGLFVGESITPATAAPALHTDLDVFYAPAIANAEITLSPSLVADNDVILAASIAGIYETQTLLPGRHTDVDSYFIHSVSGSKELLVLIWNDTDVFYLHDITRQAIKKGKQTLTVEAAVDDGDVIYPPTFKTGTLVPSLVTDADSVGFGGALTVGPASILPQKYNDDEVFYAHVLGRVLRPLTPTMDDSFKVPTVTSKKTLLPARVDDVEAFYRSLFTHIVRPPRVTDVDFVSVPDVGWKLFATFIIDPEQVYTPLVRVLYALKPETVEDGDSISTYPFFIQKVSGGIPVPKESDVLTGSLKTGTKLTGSLAGTGTGTKLTGTIGRRSEAA